ncbi:zeta toxin family protein [uncultured Dialister sp.]|jgi:UDP-N-acetylglucosamine kinase|uniref:zeta toxin family protein n=1 Tax=uncultured Dialister sp. TaxID=278064 RepID=UPI0025D26C19|nr:zeta toxin family protein [uncultured Dialister sp.]
MPYDERTVEELSESAEITPPGIQLEVNGEIFTTIHNLLWTMKGDVEIDRADEARLYSLWRTTIREMSLIELRKGQGLPMSTQVSMLREAYNIETKYMADQIFRPVNGKLTRQLIAKESAFDKAEMDDLFERTVWPSIKENKTGNQKHPMAFIIAGQPGSGKTRMSSMIIEEYNGNIVQSMSDNFRGFHPRYKKLMKKYGQYCAYFSMEQGQYLSDLTMKKAAEGRYHILQEGSLDNVSHTMEYISYLKDMGYEICVLLRACPKKESWKAIHQLFLQQRLKAPGLSRLITKDYHDKACMAFLSATNDLISQNLMDRLIIKSPKGLLYDSDDMPTERVSELLAKRMVK